MSLPALISATDEIETTTTRELADESGGRKAGRPTRFSPQLAEGICALIQFEGFSDTQAGLLIGVPRATLSRWKAQDEEFAFRLEQARAIFQREHVQRLLQARRPDGTMDWRASAWLLQRMFPEQYGSPAQRQRLEAAAATREQEAAAKTATTAEEDAGTEEGAIGSASSEIAGAEEVPKMPGASLPVSSPGLLPEVTKNSAEDHVLEASSFRFESSEIGDSSTPSASRHGLFPAGGRLPGPVLREGRLGMHRKPLETAFAA